MNRTTELSENQMLIFNIIRDYISETKQTPTNSKICELLKQDKRILSRQYIHQVIDALEKKGYIKRQFYSIKILK